MAKKVQRKGAKTNSLLQLKVSGDGVRRGRIPVPDLIRICQEMQNAVSRQAEAQEGKKTMHPGPVSHSIQQECTLELVGIKSGSTLLQFDLAKPQIPLDKDAESLASEVLTELTSTIKSFGNGAKKEIAPGVLRSLYNLGSIVETHRVSKIELIIPQQGKKKRVVAQITRATRTKMAAQLSVPRRVTMTVDGVLDMADFNPNDRRCRIDPAIGTPLVCSFDASLDNIIYTLMRKPVRVSGEALVQPHTDRVDTLHIQTVQELPSLELGKGMFFANMTIDELAASQNIKPLKSALDLASHIPDEEEVDSMLEEIYSSRK